MSNGEMTTRLPLPTSAIQKQRRHVVVRRPMGLKVRLQEIGLIDALENVFRSIFERIFQEAGAIEERKCGHREQLREIGEQKAGGQRREKVRRENARNALFDRPRGIDVVDRDASQESRNFRTCLSRRSLGSQRCFFCVKRRGERGRADATP